MIILCLLLVGGKNITMGGGRIIRGVFCGTLDVCLLYSCFLYMYKPLFVGVWGQYKTALFLRLTRDRIKTDHISN